MFAKRKRVTVTTRTPQTRNYEVDERNWGQITFRVFFFLTKITYLIILVINSQFGYIYDRLYDIYDRLFFFFYLLLLVRETFI